eukprot:CFRG5097T1
MPSDNDSKFPPWSKGFAAGVFFCQLNRRMMAGVVLGTLAGLYMDQTYVVPDVKQQFIIGLSKVIGASKNLADNTPLSSNSSADNRRQSKNRNDDDDDE